MFKTTNSRRKLPSPQFFHVKKRSSDTLNPEISIATVTKDEGEVYASTFSRVCFNNVGKHGRTDETAVNRGLKAEGWRLFRRSA